MYNIYLGKICIGPRPYKPRFDSGRSSNNLHGLFRLLPRCERCFANTDIATTGGTIFTHGHIFLLDLEADCPPRTMENFPSNQYL